MIKLIPLLLLFSFGCMIIPVQADHSQISGCFPEAFTDGIVETPDYLQLATQACTLDVEVRTEYTLKYSHRVQAVDLQMGSNAGSQFEWAFWVDFLLPDGRQLSLFDQYDKHQDIVGNRHEWRIFSALIPAGTRIVIRRPAQPSSACVKAGPWASGSACATGQKIELVGVIQ